MIVIAATLVCAGLLGLLLGGRVSALARLRIRWAPVAMVGLALQLAPIGGATWPFVFLYVSFGLLVLFAIANVRARVPGAWLILIGISLNLLVIAVNHGMPVTRAALERSDQLPTLESLIHDRGAKHRLAGPDERLVFLGDVIPIGPPVREIMSFGDVITYAGVVWLIVAGMRDPRRRPGPASPPVAGISTGRLELREEVDPGAG